MLHSSTFTLGEGRREECRISRRGSLLASSYYASPDYISLCVSRERCIIFFTLSFSFYFGIFTCKFSIRQIIFIVSREVKLVQ